MRQVGGASTGICKLFAAFIAGSVVLSGVPLPAGAASPPRPAFAAIATPDSCAVVDRIAGADRFATAVEASKRGWQRSDWVVVATGRNFPDALSGAPLAHAYGAPLLLTERDALPQAVAAEVKRLGATHAVVLGSEGAVGRAVVDGLVAQGVPRGNVERIGGSDRFDTAARIADRVVAKTGIRQGVVVATGRNYPDALAVAGYAARAAFPILLTDTAALPPATAAALARIAPSVSLVVGSEAVVSAAVAEKLPSVTRLAGPGRYDTARSIAEYAFAHGFDYKDTYLATGANFPDALAAGPLAAAGSSPLVLTETAALSAPTSAFFRAHASGVARVHILGGTPAVATKVEEQVRQAASTELAAGLRQLQDAASVAGVDGDAVRLAAGADPGDVHAGDIIAVPPTAVTPYGLLRRVAQVETTAGGTTLRTSGVALEDVIKKGSIDVTHVMSGSEFDASSLPPGVEVAEESPSPSAVSGTRPQSIGAGTGASFKLKGFDLSGGAKVDGDLWVDPSCDFHTEFSGWKLQEARVTVDAQERCRLAITAAGTVKAERAIVHLKSKPVMVPLAPGLAIPVTFEGNLKLAVSGQLGKAVTYSVGQTANAHFGVSTRDGAFASLVKTLDTPVAPSAEGASGEIKASAGLELGLRLFDLVGPYGSGYVFGKYAANATADPWWRVTCGFDARIALKADVEMGFGWTWQIANISETWTLFEQELLAAPGRYEGPVIPPDTEPPISTSDATAYYDSPPAVIHLSAGDAGGSGVKSIAFTLDAGSEQTVNGASVVVSIATAGTHALTFHASDNAGNVEPPHALLITVGTLPGMPRVTRVSPMAGDREIPGDPPYTLQDSSESPQISTDGRYVVYQSTLPILASDSNDDVDVYVYDTVTGATDWVSRPDAGARGPQYGEDPSISGDGRYVAFVWFEDDATGARSGYRIAVRDRVTGVMEQVPDVWASDGRLCDNTEPDVSGDGRFVAFTCGVGGGWGGDIYVYDRVARTTELVSNYPPWDDGRVSGFQSCGEHPAISDDGRFVAFMASSTLFCPPDIDGRPLNIVMLRDRIEGVTTSVSVGFDGSDENGWSGYYGLDISSDGRYVVFQSTASNLVPGDTNGHADAFVRDMLLGTTIMASVGYTPSEWTPPAYAPLEPSISGDGRFVAYTAPHGFDTGDGCGYGFEDIYLFDRDTGVTQTLHTGEHDPSLGADSGSSSLSGDGGRLAFASWSAALVPGDVQYRTDVYLWSPTW